ncbi:MAG: DinB family protein [Acidobacteria bacterium]|nr:DinB family protein [Acidobacteriota bacterium]
MRIIDPVLMELDQEAATTRRVLERVPGDRLTWKPHEKSMSLGQLALHVATTPGDVAGMLVPDEFEMTPAEFTSVPPEPTSSADIMKAHDESLAKAKEILSGLDDAAVMTIWSLKVGGAVAFSAPKIGIIRSIVLNHWYHHRGQLSVYLRLLGVPVPSIYGPSADENPLALASAGR